MRIPLAVLAVSLALPAFGQAEKPAPPLGNEVGFFKPAADPALTSFRPAPPAQQPTRTPVPDEMTAQIRAAEEAQQLARAEGEHEAAVAVATDPVRAEPPAIGSPLDGTARIMSPLDGTAPIISPVAKPVEER